MTKEQAIVYLRFSGFSDEQIRTIEGAFTCDKCVYSTSEGCQYDDITETIPPFDDCISRQAVLDLLENTNNGWIINKVLQLPPVKPQEPKTGWIPVSSGRLPEEGERVLATHLGGLNSNRQVIEHIYRNGRFVLGWNMDTDVNSPTFGQRYMGEIIAWMPEPEPYMAEGSGE